jgi:predicted Zn-dependent peptidase
MLVAEVLPGVEPRRVEEAVFRVLADLAARPPSVAEVERARQVLLADWALGHERIAQQALALASELALLEAGWTERTMRAIARLGPEDVHHAARELLAPALEEGRGAVVGWSLPSAPGGEGSP